jgi:hypothetical protein
MSLLDRVRACQGWDRNAYRPFVVDGTAVGRVDRGFARRLQDFPDAFRVSERAVELAPGLDDAHSRSRAVDAALRRLGEAGAIPGWRDEPYPVVERWGGALLLTVERAAVPLLGTRAYGVHVNGFLRDAGGLKLWVGRRSRFKPTGPGKLDHLIAGGQPHGISIMDNLVKEADEEAGVPADLARRAVAVGAVSYRVARQEGLRDDVLFCFDLEVPATFRPANRDGEVEEFFLWPVEQVMERMAATDDFKFNVALVNIDFLIRHGVLTPDGCPDYGEILHSLRLGGDGSHGRR